MLQFTMLLVGDHGAALSDIKKEGEGNEEWVNDSMYLTPSPVWVALRVLQLQPQFPLFSHFLSCFFFENRPKTAAVAWHFFPLSHTHDLCLPSTPPSLSRSLSCLPVFLVLFFLSPPSLSVSQHVRACTGDQGRGVVSHSTADRWEELPGVKVQSQDTPSAVGKVSARLQH